jgi:hypothetical protein
MLKLLILCATALALSGCMSASERAIQAEHADDAVCANARDYNICRQNLMSRRRDTAIIVASPN